MRNKKSVLMTLNHNYGYFSSVGSGIAGNIKLYSIEQIKSAINQVVLEGYQIEILEREIINNLTK